MCSSPSPAIAGLLLALVLPACAGGAVPDQRRGKLRLHFHRAGAAGWQLQLASKGKLLAANTLSGALSDGKIAYSIKMVHRLANAGFDSTNPVGDELRDGAGVAVGLLVSGTAADDLKE